MIQNDVANPFLVGIQGPPSAERQVEIEGRPFFKVLPATGVAMNSYEWPLPRQFGKFIRPGGWTHEVEHPEIYRRGYHLCSTPRDWYNTPRSQVYLAEWWRATEPELGKVAVSRARLLRPLTNEELLHHGIYRLGRYQVQEGSITIDGDTPDDVHVVALIGTTSVHILSGSGVFYNTQVRINGPTNSYAVGCTVVVGEQAEGKLTCSRCIVTSQSTRLHIAADRCIVECDPYSPVRVGDLTICSSLTPQKPLRRVNLVGGISQSGTDVSLSSNLRLETKPPRRFTIDRSHIPTILG